MLHPPFCLPACQSLSRNRSNLEGKNLLPVGANSFLIELAHFQKGDKNNFGSVVIL